VEGRKKVRLPDRILPFDSPDVEKHGRFAMQKGKKEKYLLWMEHPPAIPRGLTLTQKHCSQPSADTYSPFSGSKANSTKSFY
jgi:hypothetical protein